MFYLLAVYMDLFPTAELRNVLVFYLIAIPNNHNQKNSGSGVLERK